VALLGNVFRCQQLGSGASVVACLRDRAGDGPVGIPEIDGKQVLHSYTMTG